MTPTIAIDLNSDLGESFGRWVLGDDDAMLGLVTSANVACGFHAGDSVDACGAPARGPPRAGSWSGRRSATATSPGSAAGSSTSLRPSWPTTSSTRSARSTGCAG